MDAHFLSQPVGAWLPQVQERLLGQTKYCGVPVVKCPFDWWAYQELFFERRPAVVIEVGNWRGGMLLAFCHWCDVLGRGVVIGVDQDHRLLAPYVRDHPRLRLVTGDAVAVVERVRTVMEQAGLAQAEALVVEDSSHEYGQTLGVLRAYSGFVTPGGYLIVENTICHHGLNLGPQPGPAEAVAAFLAERPDWQADRSREAFGVTWNAGGYLRRKLPGEA